MRTQIAFALLLVACNPSEPRIPFLAITNESNIETVVTGHAGTSQVYRIMLPPNSRTCTVPDWAPNVRFELNGISGPSMRVADAEHWRLTITGDGGVLTQEVTPGCP